MRLWTLHPRYLDAQGLVALWREALLAQKVLRGATRGYRRHPQLARFRDVDEPVAAIGAYLIGVHEEAARRGYAFDAGKIVTAGDAAARRAVGEARMIEVTDGQLRYEWRHLMAKLEIRDPARRRELRGERRPEPHGLFRIVAGGVAEWERVTAIGSMPASARGRPRR